MTLHSKQERRMRDPIDIWNDLLHDAAEQAAADSVQAEDDAVWARELEDKVMAWLTGLRRQQAPVRMSMLRRVKIPPDIEAMDRGAILAQLERLQQAGDLQYSFHDLRGLSDHDLRSLLTAALRPLER